MLLKTIETATLFTVSGGAKPVRLHAGTIEAWTTGDADMLNSNLLKRLNDEQEKISRGHSHRIMVPVIITK